MGDNRPIGIFDSGLGGLTVVNAMAKILPEESYIYVGDTARCPYGGKDVNTIRAYAQQIVAFLQKKDVKAVIVACGTISSNVMDDLWENFDLPIIDVVRPGIESCLQLCEAQNKKRVGVIATETTIKSGFFQMMLKEKSPALDVEAKACPLFVPLIEEGWINNTVTISVVEAYLKSWQKNPIDALILGCTHYPLLTPVLKKVLENVVQIDMASVTLETARKYLTENDMLKNVKELSDKISKAFYVSGDTEKFNKMGQQITGVSISAQKIFWE